MTIGQLAKAAEVPTTTVRYYERAGLLTPPERTKSGYRMYDERAVERLRFIRASQGVGFSLDDVRELLALDSQSSCRDVQRLLENRIEDLDRKLGEMKFVRATLGQALNRCRKSRRGCPVLVDLRKRSRSECCRERTFDS